MRNKNSPRLQHVGASFAIVLAPAFTVFYETRGAGFYCFVLSTSLALLALFGLAVPAVRERPGSLPHPPLCKTIDLTLNKAYLTAFSVSTAISAVVLENRVLAWISGNRTAMSGLPWGASLVLFFLSTLVYVQGECGNREAHLFKGRPGQVLVLAAILVFCITLVSMLWVKSLALYTAMMKAIFFLALGGALPTIIGKRKAGAAGKD